MAAAYQLGYRFALIASGAGALYPRSMLVAASGDGGAHALGWARVRDADYQIHQQVEGDFATSQRRHTVLCPRPIFWFYRAAIAPFIDFFARHSWMGIAILALIGCYRLPDYVMGVMANPPYIDLGHSLATIATVVKLFGVWMTIAGAIIGGLIVARAGVMRTLMAGIMAKRVAAPLHFRLAGDARGRFARIDRCDFSGRLTSGFAERR